MDIDDLNLPSNSHTLIERSQIPSAVDEDEFPVAGQGLRFSNKTAAHPAPQAVPQAPPQARDLPPGFPPGALQPQLNQRSQPDRSFSKTWHCLYPIYFDKNRTRQEGRKVGKDMSVENPLAHTIAQAAANLGLKVAFEPDKTHPKDWANPGRVRVLLKEQRAVNNKAHLFIKVGEYLKGHPTTQNMAAQLDIIGLGKPKEPPAPPAVPRGWKLNTILPLHSPAMSGGGVSENFLKDMMAEMGGGEPAGSGPSKQVEPSKRQKKAKVIRA